jgi:Tol biopolymer transport system component
VRAAGFITIVLAVTGVIASGASSQGSSVSAPAGAPLWSVAYDRYDERRGEGQQGLDLVTSARRAPRQLTSGYRFHCCPTWSPDGSEIAYQATRGLHVMRRDGTGVRQVAADAESGSIWAPDGELIAFVVDCRRGIVDGRCKRGRARIDVVAHDGTQRRTLVRPTGLGPDAQIRLEDWSSDGRHLLFVVSGRGGDRLYSIESGGSRQRLLARSPERDRLASAAWSSDGRLVAYERRCGERVSDVYCDMAVMNANGTAKRVLLRWSSRPVHGPSNDSITWLPNSPRMIVAEWGFNAGTKLVDARTGRSRAISRKPWRNTTVGSDDSILGFFYDVRWGGLILGLARPDGTIVGRRKMPFDLGTSYDLWVG